MTHCTFVATGATLKANLGDLDRVKRIVKLTGFVNCVDGFSQQVGTYGGLELIKQCIAEHSSAVHSRA